MCNVAGIIRNNLVVDTPEEELDAVLAVNLKGVYFGCQAAAAVMIQQRRGSIINFASTGMDSPVPTISCYALTKAAVAMLTRTLATEVGKYGVRVNAMAPGFTDTPMTQRWFTNDDGTVDSSKRDELWTMRGAQAPLNCIGTARDQALGVLYLASDAARFVTGQVMRINGGVSMV
jgi:3-oxoacyl-[acyl-carrier protein] reductase